MIEAARDREGTFRKLDEVARALGISSRSLKRHLAAAGDSFSEIIDEAKFERAKVLLERGDKIEHIARELGYTEPGPFLRAFRRWTGTTPGEYRKRLPR